MSHLLTKSEIGCLAGALSSNHQSKCNLILSQLRNAFSEFNTRQSLREKIEAKSSFDKPVGC